ncbi:MAG TPA: C45 family peptidase, partial [Burkholderiaceae bacterium]|nr:C45 family peptidase [Burkholderiaceae bacterium]
LSLIDIAGTPHEAGRALGRFGARAVHEHLLHTKAWARVTEWAGSEPAAAMAALVRERFAGIWSELQGLAEGLDLPFEEVFLWNCRGDLGGMAPDGCTTVQLPGDAQRRMVHNEDGDPGFAGHCALAACRIEGSPRFVSFVYPGSLPGHTFAVTDMGLAMTVNNLRALHVAAGVPRMVLTRALLDAPTLDGAVSLLREQPRAGGFHLTLGHRGSAELLSVEFSSQACSAVRVTQPSLHANHAIHPAVRDLPQLITGSSGHRQVRGDALLEEARARAQPVDPLAILGDTANAQFPIHRLDPADTDDENTLATADIVIRASHIDWRVHEHPRGPARFQFSDGHVQQRTQAEGDR